MIVEGMSVGEAAAAVSIFDLRKILQAIVHVGIAQTQRECQLVVHRLDLVGQVQDGLVRLRSADAIRKVASPALARDRHQGDRPVRDRVVEGVARQIGDAGFELIGGRDLVRIVHLVTERRRVPVLEETRRVFQVEGHIVLELVRTVVKERFCREVVLVAEIVQVVLLVVMVLLEAALLDRTGDIRVELGSIGGIEWLVVVVLLEPVTEEGGDLVVRVGVVVELSDTVHRSTQLLDLGIAGEAVGKLDCGEVVVHLVADDVAVLTIGAPVVPAVCGAEGALDDAAAQVTPVVGDFVDKTARCIAIGSICTARVEVRALQADRHEVCGERVSHRLSDLDAVHVEADLVEV